MTANGLFGVWEMRHSRVTEIGRDRLQVALGSLKSCKADVD
ncbi:hypothetical protein RRSWK_01772 [Rhodopirellula sp. SWK7]|nr:hypothetical protein RRSWK_01772 [Rhodopirellula sp. SWK7]